MDQESEARLRGRGMDDDWYTHIEQRYLNTEAGTGARKKEQELAAGKSAARRWFEREFDVRNDERNWRRGAEGEERVAAQLAKLDRRWAVVHDLPIGAKGANLDHLIIGPSGVFALNTKHLTGRLTVYEHAVLQNGHKTTFVPAVLREVRTVQQRLSQAMGQEVRAWGVLVVMGCDLVVKQPLANLTLVTERRLPDWLKQLPTGKRSPAEVLELERAARTPGTWLPSSRRSRQPKATQRQTPSTRRLSSSQTGRKPNGVTVKRWTKYGKDRLYANGPDGLRLGYLDIATGEIVLEVADSNGVIAAHLRASHRALRSRD